MTTYQQTPSPMKTYYNYNQSTTAALKRKLEKDFKNESAEQSRLIGLSTIQPLQHDAEYWKRKNLQIESKYSAIEEKSRKITDLEQKVDLILKHNSSLSLENAQLKEQIGLQQIECQKLRNQIQSLISAPRESHYEKIMINQQFERKNYQHRIQIEKLLSEISKLHDDCFQIESMKNLQIQNLKNDFERLIQQQISSLKKSQNGSLELYELQTKKLRETIQDQRQQIEQLNRVQKREKDILLQQISSLKCDYKQMLSRKQHQLQQQKARYQHQLSSVIQQSKLKEECANGLYELGIKKLKKQISDKIIELQRLNNKIQRSSQQNEFLNNQLKQQRERLNREVESLIQNANEKSNQQKAQIQLMTEMRIENLNKANQNKIELLEGQISKMHDLWEFKQKNQKQQDTIAELRRAELDQHIANLQKQNKELRNKIIQVNQNYLTEIELLKIKMAQLHQADIASVVQVYEPKIESFVIELNKKTQDLEDARDRIHKQLQAKLHIRKAYEIELSKLRSVVMELKVNLSAVKIQMNENNTSLRSNLQSVSNTFIKDNQLKQKGMRIYEQEMRKLRQAVEAKDNQILLIEETSNKKKEYYESQINRLNEKNFILKKEIEEKEEKTAKDLILKNQQIENLKSNTEEEKSWLNQQIQFLKNKILGSQQELQNLESKLKNSQNDKQYLNGKIKKLEHQIALSEGNIEKLRMESQANINEEKEKIKTQTNISETGLKEYFMRKVKQLEEDKKQLTTINTTQSQQISELVIRYKQLQRHIQDLMQSQKKLSELENKIVHLGLDQNLIKNLGELFKWSQQKQYRQ